MRNPAVGPLEECRVSEELERLKSAIEEIFKARKRLPALRKKQPAALSASRELIAQLEALGIKLTEAARSLHENLIRLSAAGRSEFEAEFPRLCQQLGLLPITGSIDSSYRVRGAIEVRTNFARSQVRVSTPSETTTVTPPTARGVV